jgi:hypothetical protein
MVLQMFCAKNSSLVITQLATPIHLVFIHARIRRPASLPSLIASKPLLSTNSLSLMDELCVDSGWLAKFYLFPDFDQQDLRYTRSPAISTLFILTTAAIDGVTNN